MKPHKEAVKKQCITKINLTLPGTVPPKAMN